MCILIAKILIVKRREIFPLVLLPCSNTTVLLSEHSFNQIERVTENNISQ